MWNDVDSPRSYYWFACVCVLVSSDEVVFFPNCECEMCAMLKTRARRHNCVSSAIYLGPVNYRLSFQLAGKQLRFAFVLVYFVFAFGL